jgi:hypothetical protein
MELKLPGSVNETEYDAISNIFTKLFAAVVSILRLVL